MPAVSVRAHSAEQQRTRKPRVMPVPVAGRGHVWHDISGGIVVVLYATLIWSVWIGVVYDEFDCAK